MKRRRQQITLSLLLLTLLRPNQIHIFCLWYLLVYPHTAVVFSSPPRNLLSLSLIFSLKGRNYRFCIRTRTVPLLTQWNSHPQTANRLLQKVFFQKSCVNFFLAKLSVRKRTQKCGMNKIEYEEEQRSSWRGSGVGKKHQHCFPSRLLLLAPNPVSSEASPYYSLDS